MRKRLVIIVFVILTVWLAACSSQSGSSNSAAGSQNSKQSGTSSSGGAASGTAAGASGSSTSGTGANAGSSGPSSGPTTSFREAQPVTLTTFKSVTTNVQIPQGDTVDNNEYTRYIADKTNLHFKILWYASGDEFNQKEKLALASNDLPDIMMVDKQQLQSLAEAGQLADLSDAYNKYASPLVKGLYASTNNLALKDATYGGKLLGIPNISVQGDSVAMLFVRKDWLDKLNLQPPKTMDDVEKIAQAFVSRDPNGDHKQDTVGLTGSSTVIAPEKEGFHDFKGVYEAYDAYPGAWIKDGSGQVVYGSVQPEAKQALAKLQEMYKKGLIDPEFAVRKDPNQLVVSGQAGMFFGPWWAGGLLMNTYANDPKANFVPYLIGDGKGQINNLMMPVSQRYIVMKKGTKHPEAAVIYANTFIAAQRNADPDASKLDFTVDGTLWPIGYATFDYADAVQRKSDALESALAGKTDPGQLTPEVKKLYDFAVQDRKHPRKDLKVWKSYYGYTAPADLMKTKMNEVYNQFEVSTPSMALKWPNLQKLEAETYTQIIMGQKPLSAFDDFVKQWKSEGGDQITKEVNDTIQKNK